MNKKNTTAEYLRKLGYSVEENTYQTNQSQVSDCSLNELQKKFQEQEERDKILKAKFQTISDVELIAELRKRISQQVIKLSIYPDQDHIFIVAKDLTKEVSFPLPIEVKEKDQ